MARQAVRNCLLLLFGCRASAQSCNQGHFAGDDSALLQSDHVRRLATVARAGTAHVTNVTTNTSEGKCDAYELLHGCRWTLEWNCPDQHQTYLAKGIASEDGTEAFECCCTKKKYEVVPSCTEEWQNLLQTGETISCCAGLNECAGQWWGTNIGAETLCLKSCENPHSPGDIKVASFNVWWGNHHYETLAKAIEHTIGADIINIQEAVRGQMKGIMDALTSSTGHEWQSPAWDPKSWWCGLTAFRTDKWDMKWSKSVPVYQGNDHRGTCGALVENKAHGERLCVWGAHPVWRNENSWYARESIQKAAWAMKECSAKGAASIFMCDCNTHDHEAVRKELESSTGKSWNLAFADGYDMIFVEYTERVGPYYHGDAVCANCGRRGCQAGCSNPNWAYSDHPPVFVDLHLPHVKVSQVAEKADEDERSGKAYTADEKCAFFNIVDGCDWTLQWYCPGQEKGTVGEATNDGSDGYHCCCEKEKWKVSPSE